MKQSDRTRMSIQPRLLRMRDAPAYLGMSERVFNQIVRPNVREVVIGVQGIAFDREDLDQWADRFMEENAVEKTPAQPKSPRGTKPKNQTWNAKSSTSSVNVMAPGTPTKSTKAKEFVAALAQVREKKQKST